MSDARRGPVVHLSLDDSETGRDLLLIVVPVFGRVVWLTGFRRVRLSPHRALQRFMPVRDRVGVDLAMAGRADDERLAAHSCHERGPRGLARPGFPSCLRSATWWTATWCRSRIAATTPAEPDGQLLARAIMRDLGFEDRVLAIEDVTTDRLVSVFAGADSRGVTTISSNCTRSCRTTSRAHARPAA